MDPEDTQGKPTQASQPLLGLEDQEDGDPFEDPETSDGQNSNDLNDNPGLNGNSQTESRSASRHPTPTKREYAIRRYHGIGRDGEPIEPMTGQALADRLDVSRRTINRWVNEDMIPLVEGWSTSARLALLSCVVTRDREALEEYLLVRELETEAERRAHPQPTGGEDGDQPEETPFPEDVW